MIGAMPRIPFATLVCSLALSSLTHGCAQENPYCALPADATSRLTPYCRGIHDVALCDLPGEVAHFEETGVGLRLVGGVHATCDAADEIVCPPGSVGEPYCVRDPEL